jgi:hypothetical protein
VYVTIDASEVHQLADDLREGADAMPVRAGYVVSKVGHDMQGTAMDLVPIDTGHLKSTISLTLEGLGFDLGPTAYYGGYVEEGTDGPYPIENAFGWGITVEHPGNAPEPYLGPAFDRHLPDLERALGSLGVQVIRGA